MVECKEKITTCFVKLAVLIYKNKKKWEKKRCLACKQAFIMWDRYFSVEETFKASLESGTNCHCLSYYILSYRQQEHCTKALIMISCLQV